MPDSIINQAMSAVKSMAEALDLFAPIYFGPLGSDAGISMALSPGSPPTYHLDRRCEVRLSLVLNAKHQDMKLVSNTLHHIHDSLARAEVYPRTDDWQITHITTESLPELIEREADGMWLFASSLTVTLYY